MSRYHHIRATSAEQHHVDGEQTTFLATAAETDGRVAIFDSSLRKGNGAPWHFHELDDEIFYVMTGRMLFGVGEDTFIATSGDLVIVGPQVGRRFEALVDSRLLVINAPAGPSEGFLREVMRLDAPPSPEQQARFAELYKIHIGRPEPSTRRGERAGEP